MLDVCTLRRRFGLDVLEPKLPILCGEFVCLISSREREPSRIQGGPLANSSTHIDVDVASVSRFQTAEQVASNETRLSVFVRDYSSSNPAELGFGEQGEIWD